MSEVFRTLLVPAAVVNDVRSLADMFGPAAQGMWQTVLSADGSPPATAYISSGYIGKEFAAILPYTDVSTGETTMPDMATFIAFAVASGIPPEQLPSEAEISALMSAATVTDEEPFTAMARLGLQMVEETP